MPRCGIRGAGRPSASSGRGSSSPPSPFCSIWLAKAPPTAVNWLARLRAGLRIWPTNMLNCSARLGHLLTCGHLLGRELLAVHHAAAGLEAGNLSLLRAIRVISLARLTMSSLPQQIGRRAAHAVEHAGQRRAGHGPGRQAVLHHQHVDVLRPQLRPQAVVGVGVQADHVHQQGVVDVLQRLRR